MSYGILAQSIGGGGGNANFNIAVSVARDDYSNKALSFSVGGTTGDGGYGDKVKVVHSGNITTAGRDSVGILAQSIGGGGGNAGFDLPYALAYGYGASFSLGQTGGKGGYGSDVSLFSDGTITTSGDRSFGLLAQSLGNGGGNSGSTSASLTVPQDPTTGSVHQAKVSIGLEGGEGGAGGNVVLNAKGAVSTAGVQAHAVFAQSVGGGGGNGGSANTAGLQAASAAFSMGGTGGTGGVGGNVGLTNSASVRTTGASAIGVLGQSIGGGGGTGGMASTGGVSSSSSSF